MKWRLPRCELDLGTPIVMGVLNVTPDSFSDGARFAQPDAALAHARAMVADGARIVDVGGESTRPGAAPVGAQEEMDRVLSVVERIKAQLDCVISVDTMKPPVMDAACAAGAQIINDVNALRAEGALEVAVKRGAGVCLMHMQGEPRTMQDDPQYGDVVGEVRGYLAQRAETCMSAGVPRDRIAVDPGFGFGKRLEHNLALLRGLPDLVRLGFPVVAGLSRKSMFKQLLGRATDERLAGSVAAAAIAVWQGAAVVRAHDVRATMDAIRFAAAAKAAQVPQK